MKLLTFPVKVENDEVFLDLPPTAELDQVQYGTILENMDLFPHAMYRSSDPISVGARLTLAFFGSFVFQRKKSLPVSCLLSNPNLKTRSG